MEIMLGFLARKKICMDKNGYAMVNASIYCCTINDNWNRNSSYKWISFTPDSTNHILCYQGLHIKNWSADYNFKLFIDRSYDNQYYLDDLQRYAHVLAKCKKYKVTNALEIFNYLTSNNYDFDFLSDQLIPKDKLKSFVNNNMFYLMDMLEG